MSAAGRFGLARERPSPDRLAGVLAALRDCLGDRVSTSPALLAHHASTLTFVPPAPPDAVAFPADTTEVARIVGLCAEAGVPVIPFGTGTSFEGHVNAPYGGVCINLGRLDRVRAVRPADLDCEVEAGVTRKTLNALLRDSGLFFPIDPGADASLGGMASTRASGTNAVRYGTMKDAVLALEVVLPSSEIVRTARRARKSAAGYDLTRLLVGAEGTLGVVTALVLRLHGLPEAVAAGVCAFPTVAAACEATIETIQSGLPVARIELLDALQVQAVNLHSRLGLPEQPHLFVEFHGSPAGVGEQAEAFGALAAGHGAGPFDWATHPEDRTRLWQARHDVFWAGFALRPGAKTRPTDVCVPISRLADCVTATQEDLRRSELVGPIVGHVGDGNFHVGLLVNEADPAELDRVEGFTERLVARALAMDGTCTGEHGIGHGKARHMPEEHDPGALTAMAAIKRALDPRNIMNPGKILPP